MTVIEPFKDVPERRNVTAPIEGIEWRDDGDKLIFVGHAAVFDRMSEDLGGFRERFKRGAFRKVLDRDPDVRFLVNHDGLPLARTKNRTLELREDPKGLRVYAELAPTQAARDLRVLVQRGDVDQMSFGFSMFDDAGERAGNDVWEEEDGGVVRTVLSVGGLFDVSVVTFPAYTQTDASMRMHGIDVINASGEINERSLTDLAWKIHAGELDASVEERAAIDAVFARTDHVSPWVMQRALGAAAQEPELRGIIPGRLVTVSVQDDPSGQPVKHRLAARQRRLRLAA